MLQVLFFINIQGQSCRIETFFFSVVLEAEQHHLAQAVVVIAGTEGNAVNSTVNSSYRGRGVVLAWFSGGAMRLGYH